MKKNLSTIARATNNVQMAIEEIRPSDFKRNAELRAKGVEIAGASRGNLDTYRESLITIESDLRQDPSPGERAEWQDNKTRLESENTAHEEKIVRNEGKIVDLESDRDTVQASLDSGGLVTEWRDTAAVVGGCAFFALLVSGLAYFYATVLFSSVFDSSIINAIGSRQVNEINHLLGAILKPGVFATALRDGGFFFVLLLVSLSGVMIYTGVEYFRSSHPDYEGWISKPRALLSFAFAIDVLLVLLLEMRVYMTGIPEVNTLTITFSVVRGTLLVMCLFGSYMAAGRLARWIADSHSANPLRSAKDRLKTAVEQLKSTREENESLHSQIGANRVQISRLSNRLDGGIINLEVMEVAVAHFTAGFDEYLTSASSDEDEATRRTNAVGEVKKQFLSSIRGKYRSPKLEV